MSGGRNRKKKATKTATTTTEPPAEATASNIPKQNNPNQDHQILAASAQWKSLSLDAKTTFFEVRIEELKQHWSTNPTASTLLELALAGAVEEEASIVHAICFKCRRMYHTKHEFRIHLDNHFIIYYLAKCLEIRLADSESIDSIYGSSWNPVDIEATEIWMREVKRPPMKYPLSTDLERFRLVEGINIKLKILCQFDSLTERVIKFIKSLGLKEFKGTFFVTSIEKANVDMIVRSLKVQSLNVINKLLDDLISVFEIQDLQRYLSDQHIDYELSDDGPDIFLSLDRKEFALGTELFRGKGNSNGEIGTDSVDPTKLVSWIFSEISFEERLGTWNKYMDQVEKSVLKIFGYVEEQCGVLRGCWRRKHQLFAYASAFRSLKKLLKDATIGGIKLSFLDILRKQEEHDKTERHLHSIKVMYESSAISRIIAEAMKMDFGRKPEQETSMPSSSWISNRSVQMAICKLTKETDYEAKLEDLVDVDATVDGCEEVIAGKDAKVTKSDAEVVGEDAKLLAFEVDVVGNVVKSEGSVAEVEASLTLLHIRSGGAENY